MFRSARPLVSLLAAGLLVLAACGGDDSGSGSDGGATSEESSSGGGPGASDTLATMTGALEGLGYTCNPESGMTSAERELCLTTSSVFMSLYAWSDAASLDAEYTSDISCSAESTLGEIRYLKGDNWIISAIPTSGSTADYSAEIDASFADFQAALGGGDVLSVPCG